MLHSVSCHRTEDTVKCECSHILFQKTVRLPGKEMAKLLSNLGDHYGC